MARFLCFAAILLAAGLAAMGGAQAASAATGEALGTVQKMGDADAPRQLADQRPQRERGKVRRPPRDRDRVRRPLHRGPRRAVPRHRHRRYRNVIVVRPYGHWYPGYGHFHLDSDAFQWLAFTAITLAVLDLLNESQQRAHEAAQIRATTAPIGQTIVWNDGRVSGAVTALRDGTSTTGRYCREFQQTVTIGGRTEQAYGTACQQPDGAWEVVSTRN